MKLKGVMTLEMSILSGFFIFLFGTLMLLSFYIHDRVSLETSLYRQAIQKGKKHYVKETIDLNQNYFLMFNHKNIKFQTQKDLFKVRILGKGSLKTLHFPVLDTYLKGESKVYVDWTNPTQNLRWLKQIDKGDY